MEREFIFTRIFDKKVKEYKLTEYDIRKIELEIMQNSKIGAVIQGTGGIRKFRFSSNHSTKGKSSGYRIFYLDIEEVKKVAIITMIKKSDEENISDKEKESLKKLVEKLKVLYK